jgi:hypothetical protein
VKFPGELKFPDLDHPGVPVQFLIEGNQAELTLEGESLGRWSLYDVRADRLIASAFEIDLAGTEVTFVADDPIDFAYRGVEHMAKTWAAMKAKRIGARGIAVNRSRRGTVPSRIDEVRGVMEENLHVSDVKPLAGTPVKPEPASEPSPVVEEPHPADWDRRDQSGEIPAVGDQAEQTAVSPPEVAEPLSGDPSEEGRSLDEQRRLLERERQDLARQKAEAEQREANLFEAYRLEMERLERERAELRAQAAEAVTQRDTGETSVTSPTEPEARPAVSESKAAEPEPEASPAAEPETEPGLPEPEAESGPEQLSEPAEAETRSVLDLNEYEEPPPPPEPPAPVRQPEPALPPEPAMAGANKEKGGLMGAVRAAFRGGAKDHDHQFIEAPGGIGITRYVCEECGYVSISVGG